VVVGADLIAPASRTWLDPVPLVLRVEACGDNVCLRPEELMLRVVVAPLLRLATASF
jgi:hypothetical protein